MNFFSEMALENHTLSVRPRPCTSGWLRPACPRRYGRARRRASAAHAQTRTGHAAHAP